MPGSAAFDGAARPRVRTDLTTAEIDAELVVFDPLTAEIHQLDAVGSVIWPFLDGQATVDELVDDLASGFDVPTDRVRADLEALLESLQEHQLLVDETQPVSAQMTERPEPRRPEYLIDPPAP
jgi:PqqD family protein of HPr-rel-A system